MAKICALLRTTKDLGDHVGQVVEHRILYREVLGLILI